jgi:hypothetical protein
MQQVRADLLFRGLSRHSNTAYQDQMEDEQKFRVYVSPVGTLPWNWNGIRGEAFATFLLWILFLVAIVHWYYAALIWPPIWLFLGAWLSRKEPFFPEIFYRLMLQPIGYLDT